MWLVVIAHTKTPQLMERRTPPVSAVATVPGVWYESLSTPRCFLPTMMRNRSGTDHTIR
jgi:hypothetical protein